MSKRAFFTLAQFLLVSQGHAELSKNTGSIEGRAPSASGVVFVQTPSGREVLPGALLDAGWKPRDFSVSADSSELTASDLDGDLFPEVVGLNVAASTLTWSLDGVGLTGWPARSLPPIPR